MRKVKILKKFNHFKIFKGSVGSVHIQGVADNKIVPAPIGSKLLPSHDLFFSDKRIAYMYNALILSNIARSRLVHFKKLILKGIGFKCFKINNYLLMLKIGFTHKFYYRMMYPDTFFLCKKTKIIIYGNNLNHVNTLAYTLKSLRYPDIYKGKGIAFTEEKIRLKPSKKRI